MAPPRQANDRLSQLPPGLIGHHLAPFLDYSSIANLSATSKKTKTFIEKENVLKKRYIRDVLSFKENIRHALRRTFSDPLFALTEEQIQNQCSDANIPYGAVAPLASASASPSSDAILKLPPYGTRAESRLNIKELAQFYQHFLKILEEFDIQSMEDETKAYIVRLLHHAPPECFFMFCWISQLRFSFNDNERFRADPRVFNIHLSYYRLPMPPKAFSEMSIAFPLFSRMLCETERRFIIPYDARALKRRILREKIFWIAGEYIKKYTLLKNVFVFELAHSDLHSSPRYFFEIWKEKFLKRSKILLYLLFFSSYCAASWSSLYLNYILIKHSGWLPYYLGIHLIDHLKILPLTLTFSFLSTIPFDDRLEKLRIFFGATILFDYLFSGWVHIFRVFRLHSFLYALIADYLYISFYATAVFFMPSIGNRGIDTLIRSSMFVAFLSEHLSALSGDRVPLLNLTGGNLKNLFFLVASFVGITLLFKKLVEHLWIHQAKKDLIEIEDRILDAPSGYSDAPGFEEAQAEARQQYLQQYSFSRSN